MSRTLALRLSVLLSLAGLATAAATLLSIVSDYCDGGQCDDGMTTLSHMSQDGYQSRLSNGMTAALLLLLCGDEAVHLALHPRLESEALRCLNSLGSLCAVVLTALGIVSVRADPASKLHLNVGIAWLGCRIVYLAALTALCFPEAHRAGSACELCELVGAWARVVALVLVVILGVVCGVQAPSGTLSGRTQLAATLAVAAYSVCCWDTLLLDSYDAGRRDRDVGGQPTKV